MAYNQRSRNTFSLQMPESFAGWIPLLGILILTAVLYARALQNDFVHWDDIDQVFDNKEIQTLSWLSFTAIFTKFYLGMYQPLVTLSFALENALFGLNPAFFHLTNILLHLANVLLVYLIMVRLTRHSATALFTALILGIHPMHVESVAWVTERKDVLYACFYLGALLSYLRYSQGDGKKYYALSLGLFLCSLLSKSAAVTFPIIVILIDWYTQARWTKLRILEKLPMVLLSCLFGIISLVSQAPGGNIPFLQNYSIIDRFFLTMYSFSFYIMKYIFPFSLSAFHPFPTKVQSFLPVWYYLSPLLVAAALILFFKSGPLRRTIRFGLLFYLTSISLNLHFFPVGSAVAAERYAYISYIGISFIFGEMFVWFTDTYRIQLSAWKREAQLLFLLTVCLFGYLTYERVLLWKNTILLFTDAVHTTGPTVAATEMLSLAYLAQGKGKIAMKEYEGAINDLDSSLVYNSTMYLGFYERGIAKLRLQRFDKAIDDFTFAMIKNPHIPEIFNQRGLAKLRKQDFHYALADFNRAIELDSTMGWTYANRGLTYMHLKKSREACVDFQTAVRLGFKEAEQLLRQNCK